MNTPVNFEIAKMLKDKRFDEKCSHYYIDNFQNFKHDGNLYKTSLPDNWDNDNILQFVKRTKQPHLCNAPKISEVVMWLYKTHGIWIWTERCSAQFRPYAEEIGDERFGKWEGHKYNTPTKAYLKAIEYTLKELL